MSPELAAHRGELLAEEAAEVAEVSVTGPLDRLAHELADVVYVAYGTALVHGIDLDAVLAEIHRSNMTKIGPDGTVSRREDGKVLKGEHYEAPDVPGAAEAGVGTGRRRLSRRRDPAQDRCRVGGGCPGRRWLTCPAPDRRRGSAVAPLSGAPLSRPPARPPPSPGVSSPPYPGVTRGVGSTRSPRAPCSAR